MEPLDVLMAEYRELRAEIGRRSVAQMAALGVNVALVAAMVPIYGGLIDRGSVVLVAAPLVFTILAWFHLSQDLSIISIATYINRRLRPAVIGRLDSAGVLVESVLGWDHYQGEGRASQRVGPFDAFLWAMRYLAVAGPAVGFTIWGVANLDWDGFSLVESVSAVALVLGHLALLGGVVTVTALLPARYLTITEGAPSSQPS